MNNCDGSVEQVVRDSHTSVPRLSTEVSSQESDSHQTKACTRCGPPSPPVTVIHGDGGKATVVAASISRQRSLQAAPAPLPPPVRHYKGRLHIDSLTPKTLGTANVTKELVGKQRNVPNED